MPAIKSPPLEVIYTLVTQFKIHKHKFPVPSHFQLRTVKAAYALLHTYVAVPRRIYYVVYFDHTATFEVPYC